MGIYNRNELIGFNRNGYTICINCLKKVDIELDDPLTIDDIEKNDDVVICNECKRVLYPQD